MRPTHQENLSHVPSASKSATGNPERSFHRLAALVAAVFVVGLAAGFLVVSGRAAGLGLHLPLTPQPEELISTSLVINEIDYDQAGADIAEFVELKNVSGGTINLDNYAVELVNGAGGGAVVYDTIDLPNVNLAAGDYYVICANAATVVNCDLDDGPDTDFIQQGSPDAVGLRLSGALIDAVSYEGNTGAPYTETSGTPTAGGSDSNTIANIGLSRFPDGADTDNNSADFSLRCITPGDPNTAATTGCIAPTLVKLMSFTATSNSNEVSLQWQSGFEARNLGYYVYREQNGKRIQITPSLVAGSALTTGLQTVVNGGLSYTWSDQVPKGSSGPVTYWLEDVDLNGARTLHGPIVPLIDRRLSKRGRAERSELLSELHPQGPSTGTIFKSWPAVSRQSVNELRGASGCPDGNKGTVCNQPQTKANRVFAAQQSSVAGTPGVKLAVSKAGWYRITQPQLVAGGLDGNANASRLQMFVNGQEVPIKVSGNGIQLTSSDYIEFYGSGADTTTDARQTYYLLSGNSAGKRVGLVANNGALPPASGPPSYPFTLERKDRWIYYSAYLNGDAENIFGHIINATPVSQTLPVSHPDLTSGTQAQLEVSLVGVSLQAHQVRVNLNGTDLGTIDFSHAQHPTQSFNVPAALLQNGDNTVKLTSLGGATDTSLVDTLRLTYAHKYMADNDSLSIGVDGAATRRVSGFSNANVRAVDITDPDNIRELTPEVASEPGGTYAASVQVPTASAGQPHTIVLFAGPQSLQPAAITRNVPSTWSANTNRADYLVITSKEFMSSVQPLAQLRRNRGLLVNVVDVEDLYDEFSFGMHSPQAIRDFLQTAATTWARAPHYVLLAGDSSFDPKNYLGQGSTDFVPTKLFDSALMETASDDWLTDFNDDGQPELVTGRLPIRTSADAELMVTKIINYENAAPDSQRGALMVADRDFENPSNTVAGLLPSSMPRQFINRSSADDTTIHDQIMSSINQGPRLVNFIGHGGNGTWTGGLLLTIYDAPALTNSDRLSVFVMMTCMNGYFQSAYNDSLSEALMRNQGGAVAVWSSTGMTDPSGQNLMNAEFYRQVFGSQAQTLGDAARAAKFATSDQDVRQTWTLFGDPAMRLVQAPTSSSASISGVISKADGLPLPGVTVRLTGARTATTITNASGTYRFDNLETNAFYSVTPQFSNHRFSPASQLFSLAGNKTDAAFTAIPDGTSGVNAIDSTDFFVRQHYLDFLGREPDDNGFNFWSNQIHSCGDDAVCVEIRRINTSAAFFLSIEFQQSGYLVYRTYKAAYGNLAEAPVPIMLNEFLPDKAEIGQGLVVGRAGWEQLLENNKQAFMAEFVQRSRFVSAHPTTLTPAEFVERLYANVGVTPSGSDRAESIGEFGSALTTSDVAARARVLRRVGENSTFAQKELNRAFVLMQYFGYLRRNPSDAPESALDYSGYNFWLNKLNSFNGNFINAEMVKAFLVSSEYRQRFAP